MYDTTPDDDEGVTGGDSDGAASPDGADGGPLAGRLRTAAGVLGLVVLLAVVVPMLLFAVPQLAGAEHSYVVVSGSMEPVISPGDVILVEDTAPEEIAAGDVINFERAGEERTTTHRVVEVGRSDGELAFRTKGDANEDPDQRLVRAAQVRGRVPTVGGHLFVIPYLGYLVGFASSRLGFLSLLVAPLVLLVATELWDVVGSTRAAEDEEQGVTPESFDGTPTAADVVADEDDDADPETLSFRATELELGLAVLGAFLLYSGYVAWRTLAAWSVGVAASVLAALVLVLGLYLAGGGAGGDDGDEGRETVTVRTGSWAGAVPDLDRQAVADFGTLVELARATGGPVLREEDGGTHYVLGRRALYVHRGTPDGEWAALADVPEAGTGADADPGAATSASDAAREDGEPPASPHGTDDGAGTDGTDDPDVAALLDADLDDLLDEPDGAARGRDPLETPSTDRTDPRPPVADGDAAAATPPADAPPATAGPEEEHRSESDD